MSIPYSYQTPTPKFFFNSGFLDPHKQNYTNRRKFLDWVLNNFYSVPWPREGIYYEAYEYSFSIEKAAKEAGMTPKAFELQLELYLENSWMSKRPNQIKNRPNIYKFEANKFAEKIIDLKTHDDFQKENIGGTDSREETAKKGGTESKKGEPKGELRGEPFSETKQDKKGEPKGEPRGDFLKNKRTKESLCLKETSKEKETESDQNDGQDLSLSHKEKDLFIAAKENELAEHQQAIETYIDYRNISNITSKTISRWLRTYPIDDIMDAIGLMLKPGKKKVENPGGWIESALQKGVVKQERIKKQNKNLAQEMKSKNKYLRIHSRYCQDIRNRNKEFYYHMDPKLFESELRKCL